MLFAALAALAGASAVSLTAPGCARVAESGVEGALNGLLPSYLGPADRYATRVRAGSVGAVLRGRLEDVRVDGDGVRVPGGPVLDHLTLDLEDVSVDPRARRLEGVGAARFSARVDEADLNRYLEARRTGVNGLRVTLGAGTATLEARPALLARFGLAGLTVPVGVKGRLVATGGPRLDFVPEAAHVLDLSVPGPVLGLVSRGLNPVVDLSGAALPLRVRAAEIRKGSLTLSGDVPPDALLRAAGDSPR